MVKLMINEETARVIQRVLPLLQYKENWRFEVLQLASSFYLRIGIQCEDSTGEYRYVSPESYEYYERFESFTSKRFINEHTGPFMVAHQFEIPPYPMKIADAERYILDRIIDVETHEAMEFFKVNGKATFFPDHSPGGNPYLIERKG